MEPIFFSSVKAIQDLAQIIELQAQNLPVNLDQETQRSQGFVTVKHDPGVLLRMNLDKPSVIARSGDELAGYALVMPRSFAQDVPVLQPMFALLDTLSWRDMLLSTHPRWFVMGQVCVAESFRGQGVFDGMYLKMKELYQNEYDFVITEIALRNTRSMRAHERVGFKTFHKYDDPQSSEKWAVVVWDWTQG
jgi:hypothetical protein